MKGQSIAISQFDGAVKLLKIDMVTGNRKVISVNELSENQLCFGMFESEKVGSNLESVALVASPEGPLLLLNDFQYRPQIDKTRITVRDDGEFSHFRVLHEGECIFGLFYREKFGVGLHPYNNSREDVDLYYWLSKNINNPKLYEIYTKDIKYVD